MIILCIGLSRLLVFKNMTQKNIYIHATAHRIDFFLNNQPDPLIMPSLFCYKTLHISDISAHHQAFSTVGSAPVGFMQISDDHFQAESGWNRVPS